MSTKLPAYLISLICCTTLWGELHAQYVSKTINPYHKAYYDSLKQMNYPYTFPLLGKGAYKKGFDIPFPYGISTAYYAQRQNVEITRTLVGLNDGAQTDLSRFITFGKIENQTTAYTIRPDLWVLPFLNIYGVFGTGTSRTTVPLVQPVNFNTTQRFNVNSVGFGVTLAGGLGPVFIVVDNNINFANIASLVEPVPAYNLDMRIGHNFVNERRADRGISVWFGTFYQHIGGDTKGSVTIKDLLPNGSGNLEDHFIEHLNEWADGMPVPQRIIAHQIIQKIDDYLNGVDVGDTKITYLLDKKLTKPWNLIFGAQYQHNKHWQLRTEVGTYGQRTSFLIMLNYRLEHFGKAKQH